MKELSERVLELHEPVEVSGVLGLPKEYNYLKKLNYLK